MAQVAAREVMPKRKRRRRVEEECIQYVVTVTGWEHFYSFSIGNRSQFDIGPYHELATLDLKGDVLRPEGFRYPRALVTLSALADMLSSPDEVAAKSIGRLSARDDLLEAYMFVPAERMTALLTLAASNRIQAAVIAGTRLRYRGGLVLGVDLTTEFDEENY